MTDLNTTRRGLLAVASGVSLAGMPQRGAAQMTEPQPHGMGNPVNVRDLGARGNGLTDDTPAFRRAIEMVVKNGGGTIVVPAGHYLLASDFETRNGQNAILPLPFRQGFREEMIVIRIIGESGAAAFAPPVPNTGSILSTRNIGTDTNGIASAILGFGSKDGKDISFSAITLDVRNIAFMVEPGSNVVALDAAALQNCILEDVSAIINTNPGSEAAPTNPQFIAIKLPGTGNYGIVKCRNVYVEGFHYGIQHSEHADIEALINQCVSAMHIPHSYSHLAKYRITTQRCSYSLWCDAPASASFPFSNVVWGTLDIERNPAFPFKADFFVGAKAMLSGFLFYNVAADPASLYSVAGDGAFDMVVQNCAMSYRKISGDAAVSCNGWFFPVIPENLSADIRIEVMPGHSVGQRLRLYGNDQFDVTVASSTSRDRSLFHFADGSKREAYTLAAGSGGCSYLELLWAGGHWLASVNGERAVGNAERPDQPPAPGHYSGEGEEGFMPAAGKLSRNARSFPITIHVPIQFDPGTSDRATATLSIGPDADRLKILWTKDVPAGFPHGMIDTATARIPAGWYYRLEARNASFKEGTVIHF